MEEPDELAMLHHRFARTLEIEVAYNAFVKKEVSIGEEYSCLHEPLREGVTHTLLITYYSFIYSLFDPSGVNLNNLDASILSNLSKEAIDARNIAIAQWNAIATPMAKIRNNVGFHHSKKRTGASCGYESYSGVHPYSTILILLAMRLFFRHAYSVYEPAEPLLTTPTAEENEELEKQILFIKEFIDNNSFSESLTKLQTKKSGI